MSAALFRQHLHIEGTDCVSTAAFTGWLPVFASSAPGENPLLAAAEQRPPCPAPPAARLRKGRNDAGPGTALASGRIDARRPRLAGGGGVPRWCTAYTDCIAGQVSRSRCGPDCAHRLLQNGRSGTGKEKSSAPQSSRDAVVAGHEPRETDRAMHLRLRPQSGKPDDPA